MTPEPFALLPSHSTNGPLKRLLADKPPRISLLDYSPEIRNLIYSYAVVIPFVIRSDVVNRKNLKARHPDWKRRDRITSYSKFMTMCRQVYDEASPVFWVCNIFLLQAQLDYGMWISGEDRELAAAPPPAPPPRGGGRGELTEWRLGLHPGCMNMTKKLAWHFGEDDFMPFSMALRAPPMANDAPVSRWLKEIVQEWGKSYEWVGMTEKPGCCHFYGADWTRDYRPISDCCTSSYVQYDDESEYDESESDGNEDYENQDGGD